MGEKAVGRLRNDGEARVGTGVPGLAERLEGGFPPGTLVTLAGRPGTGKTIFASQFLYQGARDVEQAGMYVSMLEGRKAYIRNLARLGFDILPLEKKGLFRFLEMPTLTAEGLPAIWEEIVRNIEITKMRGTNHQMGPIPIDIGSRGISVRSPHFAGRR